MKTKILLILSFFVTLIFTSCKKNTTSMDVIPIKNSSEINLEGGEITGNGGNGTNCEYNVDVACNGILVFRDLQHFFDVYECLNIAYENHNDSFEAMYSSLNDSLYNELCDSLNFDEDLPLINFEANLNYVSYRRHYSNLENQWLNNNVLDPNTDPDNENPLIDDVLMTLFNENRAVKIGNSIFWISKDEIIYEIKNGSCDLLNELLRDPNYTDPNIVPQVSSSAGDCKDKDKNKDKIEYDNNKKMYKVLVKFNNNIFGTRVVSKVKSYKKSKFWGWKKYRTILETNVSGITYDSNCDNPEDFYDTKGPKRRRKLKCSIYRGNIQLKYLPYTISGGFFCNGNTLYLQLP